MSSHTTLRALNRLAAIHERSLAKYLHWAVPHFVGGDEKAAASLQAIATDHQAIVDRCDALVEEAEGRIDLGHFPIVFTGWHDLDFDFLLGKLIADEQQCQVAIGQIIRELALAPLAKALGEEALGMSKGHLETLEELARPAQAAAT